MTVHIISEGAKTEPTYFAAYRRAYRRLVKINHESHQGRTDPSGLVQQAIDLKRRKHGRDAFEKGDAVWVVFDQEHRTQSDLAPALALATRHGLSVAISNPCIERWFLLHLDPDLKSAFMTATEACKAFYIEAQCDKKLSDSVTELLLANHSRAIAHAKRLEQIHIENGNPGSHNPSSGLWRLIESIASLPGADSGR